MYLAVLSGEQTALFMTHTSRLCPHFQHLGEHKKVENAECRAGAPVWECCVRSRFLFMAIVASLETSRKEIIVSVGGGRSLAGPSKISSSVL